ncbi:hypothetical protein Vlu01_25020 [Micromonospora lutea]|uniref:Uncharacterized protein n=1 Tax=Micromonospora lutea TaxID=419825 RepID=A0ABQ4IVD1_9ACTN|nr:hypothetical protein Vlu01_25020 [Micromonospora lutea]
MEPGNLAFGVAEPVASGVDGGAVMRSVFEAMRIHTYGRSRVGLRAPAAPRRVPSQLLAAVSAVCCGEDEAQAAHLSAVGRGRSSGGKQ